MEEPLYLLAIVPNQTVCQQVLEIKNEVENLYGVKHAKKIKAHITLVMPFRWPSSREYELLKTVKAITSQFKMFSISLRGFGSFPPRVIYINVKNNDDLVNMYEVVKVNAIESLGLPEKMFHRTFNPHLTVATRDLTPEIFDKIWPSFLQRPFEAEFLVDHLSLFKHNGKTWDEYKQISLLPI